MGLTAPGCTELSSCPRMSSPPAGSLETKAGHPPAVKAGGMRIVRRHHSSGEHQPLEKDKDANEWESGSPPKHTVVISGAVARGDRDFPPAAAQVAHQKPQPCVEKLPTAHHIHQHIHQPRK